MNAWLWCGVAFLGIAGAVEFRRQLREARDVMVSSPRIVRECQDMADRDSWAEAQNVRLFGPQP